MVRQVSELPRDRSIGIRLSYTRVSTVAQTREQHNAALEAAGVTKTFSDVMSGARDDRPGLAALTDRVGAGDTVVVWKLDLLGRAPATCRCNPAKESGIGTARDPKLAALEDVITQINDLFSGDHADSSVQQRGHPQNRRARRK